MTQAELIAALAEETGTAKVEIKKVLNALTSITTSTLKQGGTVYLTGLGAFKTLQIAARNGRNPRTGESVSIPESTRTAFKASSLLKRALKGK